MTRPIYLIAGQSNAGSLKQELTFVIESAGADWLFVAKSGQPLTAPNTGRDTDGNPSDWHEASELQAEAIATITDALLADPDAYFAGMVWAQGEADAWNKTFSYHDTDPENYGAYLGDFIARIEVELDANFPTRDVGADTFETSILHLSAEAEGADIFPNWDIVAQNQADLAASDPRIHLTAPEDVAALQNVPISEVFADKSHYTDGFQPYLANALLGPFGVPPVGVINSDESGSLTGSDTADFLLGSDQDQTIEGNAGDDLMVAGDGAEQFIFAPEDGADEISNFDLDTDKIVFSDEPGNPSSIDDLTFTDSGKDVIVSYGTGSILIKDMHFMPFTNGTNDGIFEFSGSTDPGQPTEIIGDGGNNILEASPGNQAILTEGGDDIIHVRANDGNDVVYDFHHHNDKIVFFTENGGPQSFDDLTITDTGPHVEIDYGSGTLTLDRTAFFHFNSTAKLEDIISFSGDSDDDPVAQPEDDPETPPVTHQGTSGNDRLIGNSQDNHMAGDAGNDKLFGRHGDDLMYGGAGNNYIDGGEGDDVIYAVGDLDRVQGDDGDDMIYAGASETTVLFEAIGPPGSRSGEVDEIHEFDLGADYIEIGGEDLVDDSDALNFLQNNGHTDGTDLYLDLPDGRSIKILDVVEDDANLDENQKLELLVDIF